MCTKHLFVVGFHIHAKSRQTFWTQTLICCWITRFWSSCLFYYTSTPCMPWICQTPLLLFSKYRHKFFLKNRWWRWQSITFHHKMLSSLVHTHRYEQPPKLETLVTSSLGKDVLWSLFQCKLHTHDVMANLSSSCHWPFSPTSWDLPCWGGWIFGAKAQILHSMTLPHLHFHLNINIEKVQVFFPFVLFSSRLHGHCSPYNHPCQTPLSIFSKWVY